MAAAFKLYQEMIDKAESCSQQHGKIYHVIAKPGCSSKFVVDFLIVTEETLSGRHSFYSTKNKEWNGASVSKNNGSHKNPLH